MEHGIDRSIGLTFIALGIAACLSSSTVEAQTASASLDVSASVSRECTIATEPLAFGAYDPVVASATTPLDGAGTIIITCTQGTPANIALSVGDNADGTARQMTDGGTGTLAYEAYKDPTRNDIWGDTAGTELDAGSSPSVAPRAFTVYGRVTPGQDVPVGNYTDTLLATVEF